jgi:hypothetical protein
MSGNGDSSPIRKNEREAAKAASPFSARGRYGFSLAIKSMLGLIWFGICAGVIGGFGIHLIILITEWSWDLANFLE